MKNLKLLRKQNGLSQQKLADILNVSQQSIYKYENNLSEPDIQTLKEMSELFNASIDYIVGNAENPDITVFPAENAITNSEFKHLQQYRALSSERKKIIDMLMADFTQH